MTSPFVKTDTVLDRILARKVEEVAKRKSAISLAALRAESEALPFPPRDMIAALQKDELALIAEVKRASPSKGLLTRDFAPVLMAATYAFNGAAAISVLTDEDFFLGSLAYLRAVRAAVDLPLLRKDFVIDPFQVYEGRVAGADAILLIVAALSDSQLGELYALTLDCGMCALVEAHNEEELERALKLDAKLIGINNRDLKTFNVDLGTTARLARMVDDDVVLVAESGIRDAADVRTMASFGADAVLVGESLVKAPDMVTSLRDLSGQSRGCDG